MDTIFKAVFITVAAIYVAIVAVKAFPQLHRPIEQSYKPPEWPFLYHYTSAEGAMSIRRDKKIRRSLEKSQKDDAIFGDGVYLTSIRPKEKKKSILKNNYDGIAPNRTDRVDYFFRFRKSDLQLQDLQQTREKDIWKFPFSIDLTEIDYAFGETGANSAVIYHHRTPDATLIPGSEI